MSDVIQIQNHSIQASDTYFFDANIWIFLFCPIGNKKRDAQKVYSAFYKELIKRDCTIIINSLVLSEFANTYLRIDFKLWKGNRNNLDYKKDFVGSQRYLSTIYDIKNAIKGIKYYSSISNDDFDKLELDKILSTFGKSDFNDSYYMHQAQTNSWNILTHDRDFLDNSLEVKIITMHSS